MQRSILFISLLALSLCGKPATEQNVSAEFPFESRYIEVHGSQMHYVEVGQGDPILMLHGNPTSSYLWRNIIPHVQDQGRVIAVDLIGMGKSDKPDLDYTFLDHYRYVSGFIEAKGLRNITLVIHDWGSGLGFHYAMTNEGNVKGIAFMEAIVRPTSWSQFPLVPSLMFRLFRSQSWGDEINIKNNFFVENMVPQFVMRELTPAELEYYQAPYKEESARKPVAQWPREIPIDGEPAANHEIVAGYNAKLKESQLPKLLLWADPGALITAEVRDMVVRDFPNTEVVEVGPGLHYIQEDQPTAIGEALSRWIKKIN